MLNFKHLYYFWVVAREGSIIAASERLKVTPQTISGQIGLLERRLDTRLFERTGRSLVLTDAGKLAVSYADDIFSLGSELEESLKRMPETRPPAFRVGVADVLPKSVAHRVLAPTFDLQPPVRVICREAGLELLLGELAVHHLDLVLADQPVPRASSARAFSHKLGECGVSFFAAPVLKQQLQDEFPACLDGAPLLLPGQGTYLRSSIERWLEKQRLRPRVVAEFDDGALMKASGREGAGIFPAPAAIEDEVAQQYRVDVIGSVSEVRAHFYAISVERRVRNPIVSAIMAGARQGLFGEGEVVSNGAPGSRVSTDKE